MRFNYLYNISLRSGHQNVSPFLSPVHAIHHPSSFRWHADYLADIEDIVCGKHVFSEPEIHAVRSGLLAYYDQHQRLLPWRQQTGAVAASAAAAANAASDSGTTTSPEVAGRPTAHGDGNNVKGYAVWVSEIMLQQTQVRFVQKSSSPPYLLPTF